MAKEARIFPLLELGGRKRPFVGGIVTGLRKNGFQVGIETVDYEFQRGGNTMLRIKR